MNYSADDLITIAKKIRYDLTAAQGKLTDLMNGIAEIAATLPAKGEVHGCPQCGVEFSVTEVGKRKLTEHLANVHDDDDALAELELEAMG